MIEERKARRAAGLLTTQPMLDEYLARIADETARAATLDAMRPFLKFEYVDHNV